MSVGVVAAGEGKQLLRRPASAGEQYVLGLWQHYKERDGQHHNAPFFRASGPAAGGGW
jgi:hypothetical protein